MGRNVGWAVAAIGIAIIVGAFFVNHKLQSHATAPPPSPTPTEVVSPPLTQSHKGGVRLDPTYRSFVYAICHALQHHQAATLENDLEYYQYNEGAYWGLFNLGEGNLAPSSAVGRWLAHGTERCVRIAPSFLGHGVLATRGWVSKHGGWVLLDLDKQPKTGAWTIDDFTFGSYKRIMGSFFANQSKSVLYSPNA